MGAPHGSPVRTVAGRDIARALHAWAVDLVAEAYPSPEDERRSAAVTRSAGWWSRADEPAVVLVEEHDGARWRVRLGCGPWQADAVGETRTDALRSAALSLPVGALLFEGTRWAPYLRRGDP